MCPHLAVGIEGPLDQTLKAGSKYSRMARYGVLPPTTYSLLFTTLAMSNTPCAVGIEGPVVHALDSKLNSSIAFDAGHPPTV